MMSEAEKPAFFRILVGLQSVKPGKELTPEGCEIWWKTMSPKWTLAEFELVALELNESCTFMPGAAEFTAWRRDRLVAQRPNANEAWQRALKHAATSAYRNGPLGHALIDLTVSALGGYTAIAMCEEPDLHYLERRFTEHYRDNLDTMDARERAGISAPEGSPLLTKADGPQRVTSLLEKLRH